MSPEKEVPVNTTSKSPSLSKSMKSVVPSRTAAKLFDVFVRIKSPAAGVSFLYSTLDNPSLALKPLITKSMS